MKQYQELAGFLSLRPNQQTEFDRIKHLIQAAHLQSGFRTYDAPLIYRADALLAKSGGETDKQVYQLEKGDAKLALRFDLTVPLALFVAGNQRELAFPLKISQINKVYRGEKTGKGRLREFYQCDADVIARGTLPLEYDAECIALVDTIYSQLFAGRAEFVIRLANRKLLTGFLESLGLGESALKVRKVIDDAEKISAADFQAELQKYGVSAGQFDQIKNFIELRGDADSVFAKLDQLDITTPDFLTGIAELKTLTSNLQTRQVKNVILDLAIVRGLDYYTGTVFETNIKGSESYGSIMSGGRYDNLVSNYSSEKFEGVGASIGLSRLYQVLVELGLIQPEAQTRLGVDLLFLPIGDDPAAYQAASAFAIASAKLAQASGQTTDILFADRSLSKKMEYANKSGAKNVAVIGDQEVQSQTYQVKPL
ncbi:histidine--tRNA ligase [Candidatus Saccharibacteria bacterium]|nr:histidine--tRNA ligase [Candidatus Saccharibacteria bacterium]